MDHYSAHPSGFLHSKISSLFPRFVPRTPRLCSCQNPSYTHRHSHPWAKAGSRSPRTTQMLFCPSQRPSNLHKSFSHQEASCRAAGWSTHRTNETKKRVGSPFAHKSCITLYKQQCKEGKERNKGRLSQRAHCSSTLSNSFAPCLNPEQLPSPPCCSLRARYHS